MRANTLNATPAYSPLLGNIFYHIIPRALNSTRACWQDCRTNKVLCQSAAFSAFPTFGNSGEVSKYFFKAVPTMGPAVRPPEASPISSPSTTTLIATCGFSTGANATIHARVSFFPLTGTCAVPLFAATLTPSTAALLAVPLSTAAFIPSIIAL